MSTAHLLYVHPSGHLNDWVVPAGALAALNAVEVPKLGRYAFEVTADEIRRASVLAVDLHWALALPGFTALVRHVRGLKPELPVIAGGISAGLWAERLLAEGLADFVVQGDAERAFPELVTRLLARQPTTDIPNVHARGAPARTLERVASLDGSDSQSSDWFPTHERLRTSAVRAFSADRTLIGQRGCALCCTFCHGSWAGSFGAGRVERSPEALAREVERAAREGARHLRIFLGKPSASELERILSALSAADVAGVASDVGLMCCRAPAPDALERLERALSTRVAISVVDPALHQPENPARAEREWSEWRSLAAGRELDVWTLGSDRLERLRADLAGTRARVSYAGSWEMARPTAARAPGDFDALAELYASVWTFHAAKLLSPSLDALLAPFGLLDDMPDEPRLPERPAAFRPLAQRAYASFDAVRLPVMPDLRFAALPLDGRETSATGFGDVMLSGEARVFGAGSRPLGSATPLAFERDHRGVLLRGALVAPPGTTAVALVPDAGLDDAELARALRDGLLGLRFEASGRVEVEVRLALACAWLTLVHDGRTARAGADLRQLDAFSPQAPFG